MDYYIEDGVRRAVAARESGLKQILAKLYEQGKPPSLILADLGDLYSPKTAISQSEWRFVRAEKGMASAQARARMPPILIQPLGEKGQTAAIPLAQVALDP